MDRIRIQLGKSPKSLFEMEFDGRDARAVFNVVRDYMSFYSDYIKTHSTSARSWSYPYVFMNGKQTSFNVGPNGNWWDDEKNDAVLWKLDFTEEGHRMVWLNFVESIRNKLAC